MGRTNAPTVVRRVVVARLLREDLLASNLEHRLSLVSVGYIAASLRSTYGDYTVATTTTTTLAVAHLDLPDDESLRDTSSSLYARRDRDLSGGGV